MSTSTTSTAPWPRKVGYSDVALVVGIVAIIGLMIMPLPLLVIDILVGISISLAIGLLLVAIYIPSPVAFSSFPSVIMLTTLFRLSLSIAITKQILLDADAGEIVDTFGNIVAGGNLVVGLVVFLIITVVQFIVIAKGAERVAEVAARFSLDAMPGKQLSIDSDLRSGLLDKEGAKAKRRHLEIESQLHGSLDGAMKFVKGDAIAGIVIIIVNLLGGLAIGILQVGMSLGEAAQTYSILTIGDGLVAQFPALLSSIAAGLIVTRTSGDSDQEHLAQSITRQVNKQPRVLIVTGVIALILMWVPGFPKMVFLALGLTMLAASAWRFRHSHPGLRKMFRVPVEKSTARLPTATVDDPLLSAALALPAPLEIRLDPSLAEHEVASELTEAAITAVQRLRENSGVPIPNPMIGEAPCGEGRYEVAAAGIRIAQGALQLDQQVVFDRNGQPLPDLVPTLLGSWIDGQSEQSWSPAYLLGYHLDHALRRNLDEFLGIQEVSTLISKLSEEYPDLVKETLRVVAPQRITDVLRRLVVDDISIRGLRSVFEALADAGSKEKDIVLLTELVRVALKRQISDRFGGAERQLAVLQIAAQLEDLLRQSVRVTNSGSQLALDPMVAKQVLDELRVNRDQREEDFVVLTSMDVRRHARSLIEIEFFDIPVLSYQELTPDLRISQLGQLGSEIRGT